MTDINLTNSLLPDTTQTQRSSTVEQSALSNQAQARDAGTTSPATMPQDSVEMSKEALAAAYDQAYTQANMGQLYSDDTVAGTAYVLSEQAKQAGVTQGDGSALASARSQLGATQLTDEQKAKLKAAIDRLLNGTPPPDLQKWASLHVQMAPGLQSPDLTSEQIEEMRKQAEALQKSKGDYQPINAQAISGIYSSGDAESGFSKAIDYALKQRGLSRDQVADIDLNQALYDGTVRVTFKDGTGPVDLAEDYVTHFAVKLLREQNKDKWDSTLGQFDSAYAATLDKLGLDRSDVVGWSVKTDGKFHLFTLNATSDGYDEQVVDDPNLTAAALAQAKSSADQLRLADFNGISWAKELARRMG